MRLWVLLLVLACLAPRPARACGAFPSGTWVKAPPRLGLERTLIVWDSATRMQHFVRELRFAHAGGAFGFVVPTPSRPSVHSVEKSPFDALEKSFGSRLLSQWVTLGTVSGVGYGAGLGAGRGAKPPPVQVVETKRVGDFTAFILTATDKSALGAWLEKHGFKSSDAGKAWMDGYIRLGFHFVALRYDGTPNADEEMTSRTLRISFESELPYYPYREPTDAPEQKNRELSLWVVSDALVVPYAGVTHQAEWRLRRPFSEGDRYVPAVGELEESLGKELSGLLPRSRFVQTFGDFKPKRHGWEDVLFVPSSDCDDDCRSARARLLPLLDARLEAAPSAAVPAPSASANALSCGLSGAGAGAWWLPVAALLCLRRRRWVGLLVLLWTVPLACERGAPSPAPAASTSAALAAPSASASFAALPEAFIAPRDPEARRQAVLDVLANRFDGYVPVWSLPEPGGLGASEHEEDSAFTETLKLAGECAAGLDVVVTLEADLDAKGAVKKARALGPLPKKTRECIEKRISETVFSPEGGERTERTHGYFGARSEEAQRVARSLVSARSRVTFVRRARLRTANPKVSDGLPEAIVLRVIRSRHGLLVACHAKHAAQQPNPRVLLQLRIDAEGAATGIRATVKQAPALGTCVADALRPMTFPKPTQAPVSVSVELVFATD